MALLTQTKYPGTVVDNGGADGAWTNPSNAVSINGSTANGDISSAGSKTNYLKATNFGFKLPSGAIIDGIKPYIFSYGTRAKTRNVSLVVGGSLAGTVATSSYVWDSGPLVGVWHSYGGESDTWGLSLTPSDIMSSTFGFAFTVENTSAGGTAKVDAVAMIVYWHAPNSDVQRRVDYLVYDKDDTFLGRLPNVTSRLSIPQEINTLGSSIVVTCGSAADILNQPPDYLYDESGSILTDESSNPLYAESAANVVALGTTNDNTLIKNGNTVKVVEYNYYYPNGITKLIGKIEKWTAEFGGENESIDIYINSSGKDFNNYLARDGSSSPVYDQTQTSYDSYTSVYDTHSSYNVLNQTFKTGVGITTFSGVTIRVAGTGSLSVQLYSSSGYYLGGSNSVPIPGSLSSTPGEFTIQTPIPIDVSATTTYEMRITPTYGTSANVYYNSTSAYADGGYSIFAHSSGSGDSTTATGGDLYFKTITGSPDATVTFTSEDPTTGMLMTLLDNYASSGGTINYSTDTIEATSLSLTTTFNTETMAEALGRVLNMSPSGFYYYVDLETDTLYFEQASTSAELTLVKGIHVSTLTLSATIENVKNQVYFSGGETAGVNLFKTYSDSDSIDRYGVRLDRKSDNRVTVAATANAIGDTAIATGKDEQYQTTITIADKTLDIALIKPGMVVNTLGFGIPDSLLLQVIRIDYKEDYATITLGTFPKRFNIDTERVTRGLLALQTVANPVAPS